MDATWKEKNDMCGVATMYKVMQIWHVWGGYHVLGDANLNSGYKK